MKTIRKLLVGPHHGEYNFPETTFIHHPVAQCRDIGYLSANDMHYDPEHDILIDTLKPYFETHEHTPYAKEAAFEHEWGHFTDIHLDFTPQGHADSEWLQESYVREVAQAYLDAFINAKGDDSTFDYMPSFTECLEQILTLLDQEPLIKRLRKACYFSCLDHQHAVDMEFFLPEELEQFKNP
jgi:hypothetical protein